MSTRTIITIDEEKCNGCGLCIPNCPEGALQIIDGKARLVSDLFCDGLGACVGYCPQGAITLTQREAEPYDERRVMEGIARQGANTIKAHLAHLDAHGEKNLLSQALSFLAEKGVPVPEGWSHEASPKPGPAKSGLAAGRLGAGKLADPAPPDLSPGAAIQGQGRPALRRLRRLCRGGLPCVAACGQGARDRLSEARRRKGHLPGEDHGPRRPRADQHADGPHDGGPLLPGGSWCSRRRPWKRRGGRSRSRRSSCRSMEARFSPRNGYKKPRGFDRMAMKPRYRLATTTRSVASGESAALMP